MQFLLQFNEHRRLVWLLVAPMALRYERPIEKLAVELSEVSRDATALLDYLGHVNVPLPADFPTQLLVDIAGSLVDLPEGTARGCRSPLLFAQEKLAGIRGEHIQGKDNRSSEGGGEETPRPLRREPLDGYLTTLMSSVSTALQVASREAALELEISDRPEPTVEPPLGAAEKIGDHVRRAERKLSADRDELDDMRIPGSANADRLRRRLTDTISLNRLAHVELGMPRVVPAWLSRIGDSLREYPRLIVTASTAIRVSVDVAEWAHDRWSRYNDQIFKVTADAIREVSDDITRFGHDLQISQWRRQLVAKPPPFTHEEIRDLIISGKPIPLAWRPLVASLDISNSAVSDLSNLSDLTNLRWLSVSRTDVTDLSPIASLTKIEHLDLSRAQVTDLRALTFLSKLRHLDLDGLPVHDLQPLAGLSMIFQEPMTALNPLMPVGRQVEEVFAAHGLHRRTERRRRVLDLLDAMGLPGPDALYRAYPFRLSGGQRQRVMIAMALALEPALLIADEPTTALDVTTQAQILALIKEEQSRRGMGVLFITHDFGVVAEIADRVAIMQSGRIVETGTARDVLSTPRDAYTRKLIAAVPRLPATPLPACDGKPLLQVDNLEKAYLLSRSIFGRRKTRRALDRVSLQIRPGETLGLVGESGSGKSTVGRCIVRLIDADTGTVRFAGVDIQSLKGNALRRLRRRIQIVFQDPFASLNPRRKIDSIIMKGPLVHGIARSAAAKRVTELLRLVGLDSAAVDRYPHEFSGGQRQRIGIARALALDPELIVADEPVSALDVSIQAQVLELLSDLRTRLGLAMLFITHDLRVAAQICDTIAVMKDGQIVEYGPTATVFGAPRHPYTRQLLDAIPGKHWRPLSTAPTTRQDVAV